MSQSIAQQKSAGASIQPWRTNSQRILIIFGRERPHYLPRREVGVAGNILMLGTVYAITRYLHGIVPVSGICLSANLNSFNISGMDEAALFKFGKWVEYDDCSTNVKHYYCTHMDWWVFPHQTHFVLHFWSVSKKIFWPKISGWTNVFSISLYAFNASDRKLVNWPKMSVFVKCYRNWGGYGKFCFPHKQIVYQKHPDVTAKSDNAFLQTSDRLTQDRR